MSELFSQLIDQSQALNFWEAIAVITALIYIYLAAKGNRWCFLFGLISSTIYIYLSASLKFYFDTLINSYYVVMSFYGWIVWSKNTEEEQSLVVKTLSKKAFLSCIVAGFVVTFLSGFSATQFSDAALPFLDAFTTVFSIIATWMVVKKQIENWLIWIVVDAVASGMYFYKELYLTSLLFIIYTIIAIRGYFKWQKLLKYD
jgi:nicotinamide mononucleotide transporter